MFHKNIKLALAFLTIIWSVFEFKEGHIGNGIAILLLTGMFVLLYFKNEFILLSFLSRGLRFLIIGYIVYQFGDYGIRFIKKNKIIIFLVIPVIILLIYLLIGHA